MYKYNPKTIKFKFKITVRLQYRALNYKIKYINMGNVHKNMAKQIGNSNKNQAKQQTCKITLHQREENDINVV